MDLKPKKQVGSNRQIALNILLRPINIPIEKQNPLYGL